MALTPLKEQYQNEIAPAMMEEFGYRSKMQVPRMKKITINIGLGEALDNAKAIERSEEHTSELQSH